MGRMVGKGLQRCMKTFLRVIDSHFLESGDGFIGDITAF